MKSFTLRICALVFLVFISGMSFAQFKIGSKSSVGQTLTVDPESGAGVFSVNFNTDKPASTVGSISKCQTNKGIQMEVRDTTGSKKVAGDFKCDSYRSYKNLGRVSSVESLVEILGADAAMPAHCLFDIADDNQAAGAYPGIWKNVKYIYYYRLSGLALTSDITFDVSTYFEGQNINGATASYSMRLQIGSLVDSTFSDFYVSGSAAKTVSVAGLVDLTPADLEGVDVFITFETEGSGTPVAAESIDPIIVFDNFSVEYQSPMWVDPATGITANTTVNNTASPIVTPEDLDTPVGIHIATNGRSGQLKITNDWDTSDPFGRKITLLETGALKAKDANGEYTVDVPYTLTPDGIDSKGVIAVDAPASGTVDDDYMFYFKIVSATDNKARIELDCGVRIWYDAYWFNEVDLSASDDAASLKAAIGGLTGPANIILKNGVEYDLSGTGISQSMVIKSADPKGAPAVLDMGGSSLDVAEGSSIGLLKFLNVEIKGDVSAGYLMNFSTTGSISDFVIEGSSVHNLRGVFRAKNNTPKTITNYIIENCIIDSIGGYTIMQMDADSAYCTNVTVSNSTLKNIDRCFRWRSNMDAESMVISNCTFYNAPYGGDLFRMDNTITKGIKISNTIFGLSNNKLLNGTTTIDCSNSYVTSDCQLSGFTTEPTAYAGASTDLFVDPVNGDFTIKDESFDTSVGDPRWIPATSEEPVLKHSYTFEDGTANDVISGANGELQGEATVADGALVTAANGDYLKLPAKSIKINEFDAVTMEAFVETGTNPGWTMLAYFGSSWGDNSYWMSIARDDNVSKTSIDMLPSNSEEGVTGVEPGPGEKHHYVSVLTDTEIKWYIDGELIGIKATADDHVISGLSLDTALVAAGGYPDPTWNGSIYEFNIYNGELDVQTIAANADGFLNASDATLASITLSDGELTPVFDATVTEYAVAIPEGVSTITLSAMAKRSLATVSGTGDIDVSGGAADVTITCTAVDGETTKDYIVHFTTVATDCFVPLYSDATNLVSDAELTDLGNFGGWGTKSITYDPQYVYCGLSSGKVVTSGSIDVNPIPFKPETQYRLKAMVYTEGGEFRIGIDDGNGELFAFLTTTTGEWETIDTVFTTAANSKTGLMYFNNHQLSGTLGVIDNWELYEVPSSNVKEIVFVTTEKHNIDSIVVAKIDEKAEYNVTRINKNVITEDMLDQFNAADVVIMGRGISSSDAGSGKAVWNAITSPVLSMNMWALRGQKDKCYWTPSTSCQNLKNEADVYIKSRILFPEDPVFEGLSGTIDWWGGNYSIFGVDAEGDDAGNGQLMALTPDGRPLFMRWAKDVAMYPHDDAAVPAGDRSYIGNGSDDGDPDNYFAFSADAEKIFWNELARLASGEPTVIEARIAKVAYVNQIKDMDASATQPDNDPVIQTLKADPNIDLTVMVVAKDADLGDLSGYDMVVVQEGFSSGSAILKPGASLGIATIPVPFIYNKMYGLRDGNALTSGSGASNESSSLTITVDEAQQGNSLFKGLTFTDNTLKLLNGTYNDTGAEGTKAFNYNTGNYISSENTLIAQPSDVTDAVFFINDVAPGDTVDSEVLANRMLTMGMNFGAMSAAGGSNMTSEALTIWRNAVYMLAGGLPIPAEPVPPIGPAVVKVAYVNVADKAMDARAAQTDSDPIIKMLQADDKFEVDVLLVAKDAVVDLSGYDVVIAQEGFSSSSAIFKPGGSLGMGSIPVPFILNKAYTMKEKRGFVEGTAGSGGEIAGTFSLTASEAGKASDIFKGIDVSGEVPVFITGAADDGSPTNTKGLQYAVDVAISAENTLLANGVNDPDNVTVCINDIPSGATIGSETLQARMIAFSMNFGAICAHDGKNFTDEGITLWRNAVYSLAGIEVPAEMLDVENHVTKVAYATSGATADPISEMLGGLGDIVVDVVDGSGDYSSYDVVIGQESFNSDAAAWAPDGSLNLRNNVPMLMNKTWAWKSGKPAVTSTASVDRIAEVTITVAADNQENPLFTGIEFDDNSIKLYAAPDGDAGLDVLNGLDMSKTNTLLASASNVADEGKAIVINDIPMETQIGTNAEDVTGARIIAFCMPYGTLTDITNVAPENLTMWRNAVYILACMNVPTTLVPNDEYVSSRDIANSTLAVYPNPTTGVVTVEGADIKYIEVYNMGGARVNVSTNGANRVDASALEQGTYLMRVTDTDNNISVVRFTKLNR